MKNWLKNNWIILVILSLFIPVGKRQDGSKERLSSFIIRQATAAVEDTFAAFSFGDTPSATVVVPTAPAVAPQQTAPPTATAPVVASRTNVAPSGNLSPVVQIKLDDGQMASGQWLLAGDGGIAHHGNPQVALNDLKTRIPGDWLPVTQPNGRHHFFLRQP
jgi:hypothetical protein